MARTTWTADPGQARLLNSWRLLLFVTGLVSLWLIMAGVATAQSADPTPTPTLENGRVTGQAQNGTTGETVTAGIPIELYAYNSSFTQADVMTTTLGADGRYQFDLAQIPTDWVYMTTLTYKGLEYSSDIGRFSPEQPQLNLPLTVYEQTMDTAVITIAQLHVTLNFAGGQMQVSELYTFNNNGTAVFVGETGDFSEGTVNISLPDGAQNPTFQRGFGRSDNFFPANEVMRTATGWSDTLPLRPGPTSLTLLVTYSLPYLDKLILTHPLSYATNGVILVLPENGVTVGGEKWQQQGTQMTATGALLSYTRANLTTDQTLAIQLSGQPRAAGDNPAPSGNVAAEWAISGGVLMLLLAVIGRIVYYRRQAQPELDESPIVTVTEHDNNNVDNRRDALLQAIANLDNAYEAGAVAEGDYIRQRQQLKAELITIW